MTRTKVEAEKTVKVGIENARKGRVTLVVGGSKITLNEGDTFELTYKFTYTD